MSRNVAIVSHSHWDREWYAGFESYRIRLVAMIDRLLDLLEGDPGFAHFHLDGQTALVDDYLAIRPEARSRLQRLVEAGRLAIGPWYVLMDEFCVSGETLIRNLQLGLARTADFGGPPPIHGYLPDMFGHVSQMPQLLKQAGIEHAVVWRGVPLEIDRTAFWWQSPDGSTVRAEYLPVGYANGAFLPHDANQLIRRVAAHERELVRFLRPDSALLLMNGGDHHGPQDWVPDLIRKANSQADGEYQFAQTSLADYLSHAPDDDLPSWTGELRSGGRAPMLMGVLSSRVDIKQAAAATELALERTAEPLAALWLPPELWPADLVELAWTEVIRNSAHDSICGCSADEVGRAVLSRYDSAAAAAAVTIDRAAAIAGVATESAGPVVLNPSFRDRIAVVELDLPGPVASETTQPISKSDDAVIERRGAGRDLAVILAQLAAEGFIGSSAVGQEAHLEYTGPITELTIDCDPARSTDPGLASVMAEAWAAAGSRPDVPLIVRVRQNSTQRVVAAMEVPGWGWSIWNGTALPHRARPVKVSSLWLDNGLVSIDVDPTTGTFALDGIAGQNVIVHEADAGDTYNFSPARGASPVTAPTHVTVKVIEEGPVRGVIRVRRHYIWAERLEKGHAFGHVEVEVVTDIELRCGEPAVRITTSFDNRSRDHRVRACFPLPKIADRTVAECAFATVARASHAEGGPHEHPLPAYPSRRFVSAGDITITHQGLLEHELIDGGRELAVTLLRATGFIARPAPAYRPVLAGPPVPLREGQMPGPQTFRYALARGCSDPWELADQIWTPFIVTRATGIGHLPDKGRRLRLEGAEVSALYRRGRAIEVRVFNPSDHLVTVRVPEHSGWLLDLKGDPIRQWADEFELDPWAIATARLDAISLD